MCIVYLDRALLVEQPVDLVDSPDCPQVPRSRVSEEGGHSILSESGANSATEYEALDEVKSGVRPH